MSRTDGPERGRKTEDLYGKSVLRPRRREAARREPAEHDNISTAKPPGWAALLFPSPCSSEPYVTKKGSVHSSAAAGGTQTEAQRQRVRFGEEEQGSAAQFLPQAETERSGLCDDDGAAYRRGEQKRCANLLSGHASNGRKV